MQRVSFCQLSKALHTRRFVQGEKVVKAGEAGASMFIIVEGFLEVFLDIEVSADDVRVATMSPGDYFGEMSLVTGTPRSATIITRTDALIYEIDKDSIEPLFETYPALPEAIAHTIAHREFLRKSAVAEAEERMTLACAEQEASAQLLRRMKRFFQL